MRRNITIIGPFGTSSGYGARARDIAYALLSNPNYNVSLINTRWGETPQNFLKDDNPVHAALMSALVLDTNNLPQPDISIQITIPDEFQRIGKYSIGVTAGIESTVPPPSFIEGCNRVDHVLFSSTFSQSVHTSVSFNANNPDGSIIENALKLKTKTSVLHEGVDLNVYKKSPVELENISSTILVDRLSKIKEQFCYLTVGHWLPGDFNEDRKNISGTIWAFFNAFKNKKNTPALILKTSCGTYSEMDLEEIKKRVNAIRKMFHVSTPPVYLIHGDLTDIEMNDLYNFSKVKAMLLLTKGEGYGRPFSEFAVTGKPIIAPYWSGYTTFLEKDHIVAVPGKLTNIHPSAANKWLLTESHWFTSDLESASQQIQSVYNNYDKHLEKSRKTTKHIKDKFSLESMKTSLFEIIDQIPMISTLNLPKLKKLSDNDNK